MTTEAQAKELNGMIARLDTLIRGDGTIGQPGLADGVRRNRDDIRILYRRREKSAERVWQWVAILAAWAFALLRDVLIP